MTSLINKYRPTTFEQVIGQPQIVAALHASLTMRRSHAYLLVGPSGTGKTTLARIAAHTLCTGPEDLQEIDAATYNGIDAMRSISSNMPLMPLLGGSKSVILDECHRLSAAAWSSLLKSIEEPPSHAFWFFCTTDASAVPAAILTRCERYDLHPVLEADLIDRLLVPIAAQEGFKAPTEVLGLCARFSLGSPRQALSNLAKCADCITAAEARALLAVVDTDHPEAVDLARAIFTGAKWSTLIGLLAALERSSPESVRHVVVSYAIAVLKSHPEARNERAMMVLDALADPLSGSSWGTMMRAVGRLCK